MAIGTLYFDHKKKLWCVFIGENEKPKYLMLNDPIAIQIGNEWNYMKVDYDKKKETYFACPLELIGTYHDEDIEFEEGMKVQVVI
jgi:hypothetical protein